MHHQLQLQQQLQQEQPAVLCCGLPSVFLFTWGGKCTLLPPHNRVRISNEHIASRALAAAAATTMPIVNNQHAAARAFKFCFSKIITAALLLHNAQKRGLVLSTEIPRRAND